MQEETPHHSIGINLVFSHIHFLMCLRWKDIISKDVEIWALQPTEISDWKSLIEHLTHNVPIFNDNIPITFYGHSYGGTYAYEAACRLQKQSNYCTTNRIL